MIILMDVTGANGDVAGKVISVHASHQLAYAAQESHKGFCFSVGIRPKTRVVTIATAMASGDTVRTTDLVADEERRPVPNVYVRLPAANELQDFGREPL